MPPVQQLPEIAVDAGPRRLPPAARLGVALLLLGSLACNISALLLPFMHLRIGLKTQPYSLFHSVQMLWTSHLQILAVLVVAFSIVFPFVKLGFLAWLCAVGTLDRRRMAWLALVDRLGKWSMLDVFIVCLILGLASGQLLVGAEPLVGLPVFAFAILLSMASGEILSASLPHAASPRPVKDFAFGLGGLWLLLSGAALLGALRYPFLQISDWFVKDNAYSVTTLVPTLVRSNAAIPASVIGAFLVVFPVATWIASCIWWGLLRAGRPATGFYRLMMFGRRWSMLDVFGLALAVFAAEGDALMKTQVRTGALFLAAMVAIQLALQSALIRAFGRRHATTSASSRPGASP
ncbi:MAG TPA: paraquat-inducible protein A [Opitutaceae bacterium]|jgi:paraquat-inducible protein A|nr:paraquat-inducible protein A [Opitutaceae bacterium]